MRITVLVFAAALLPSGCSSGVSSSQPVSQAAPAAGARPSATAAPVAQEAKRAKPANPKPSAMAVRAAGPQQNYNLLRNARQYFDLRGPGSAEFQHALQGAAHSLREVRVTAGDAPLVWNKLTLNATGARIDGFRFRCPLEQPADMHWIFTTSRNFDSWYILATDGSLSNGFESYATDWNLDAPGAGIPPGQAFRLQTLPGGRVQPGREYIVWLADNSTAPLNLHLAIRLSPAGSNSDETDVAGVARGLRLDLRYPEFEAPKERVPQILSVTRDLFDKTAAPGAAHRALMSLRQHLPEVPVRPAEGPADWVRVSPDDSFVFHAVRIRSPIAVPADLHLALCLPYDAVLCKIVSEDGQTWTDLPYQVEVDVPFNDSELPRSNLTVLQTIGGGRFQPGHDYFLCFRPVTGVLPDFHMALRFSPAGAHAAATSAEAVAAAIGFDLPAGPPAAGRVDAALRRCREMHDRNSRDNYTFCRLLEFALPALPELRISDEQVVWNTIDSQAFPVELRFGAFRFASPLTEQADLDFLLVKPQSPTMSWACFSFNPDESRFSNPTVDPDVHWEGQRAIDGNLAAFQSSGSGCILPGRPHVIFFIPQEPAPLTFRCALLLSRPGEFAPTSSTKALAARFGLKAPSASAQGGRVFEAHDDGVTGVAVTPDGALLATSSLDGKVNLWGFGTDQALRTLEGGPGPVEKLYLNSSGSHLAAAKTDEVFVWDMQTYERVARLSTQGLCPQSLCLSADGRWLAVCSPGYDRRMQKPGQAGVLLWDLAAPARPQQVRTNEAEVACLAFTADGQTLILGGHRSGSSDNGARGLLQFVDRDSLKIEHEFADAFANWRDMAVSADGRWLAGARDRCLLQVWDLRSREVVASVGQDSIPEAIAISPDGTQVATASSDGTVRLWEAASLRMARLWRGHHRNALACAFAPFGDEVVSGGSDSTVRHWELRYRDAALSQPGYFEPVTNSIGMRLMPVPGGEFLMGLSPNYDWTPGDMGEESLQHRVKIGRPFYMAAHEVTVAQFRAFIDQTGYVTTAEKSPTGGTHRVYVSGQFEWRSGKEITWKNPGYDQQETFPVSQVSWDDAVAFCEWLSLKERARYRLPTEAEWEYACRGGTATIASFGNRALDAPWCANVYPLVEFARDRFDFAAPVGSFLPNSLGLYDMHGNVQEWCSDWFEPGYYRTAGPIVDPQGAASGTEHIQRGGSFAFIVNHCRSSARVSAPPGETRYHTGFRVVREMP